MAFAVFVGSLLGAIVIGLPIAIALLASGIMLMVYLNFFDSMIIYQNLVSGANSFPLLAIPFFVLAGELMNAGGMSSRIIDFAKLLVGHIRGGLGYVAIIAGLLFAGLSGSAMADAAALCAILIPMMVKAGYNKNRSAGLIAAGSIMAPLIPPSIPLILFGVTANVSITKLFIGGIIPGVLIAIGLTIVWAFYSRRAEVQVFPRKSGREIWLAARHAIWALFLPILILGGLRGGVFTPTEAAVVAVFYAFFVGAVVYRELKIRDLFQVLVSSAKTTSVIMFLVAAAMVSAWLITVANIPDVMLELLKPLIGNPLLLLIVINLLVLLLGMVLDLAPIILILTPVLMPVIQEAGIDPVYFGILFVLNCSIGMLTPPVGAVLNVTSGVGKLELEQMIRGVWPFLLLEILILLLLILFPRLVIAPLEWLT